MPKGIYERTPDYCAKLSAAMRRPEVHDKLLGNQNGLGHVVTPKARFKISIANTRHGHRPRSGKSPTYITWSNMLQRCRDPNATRYRNWGGRGIKVCKRWLKFENFLKDMGEKPKDLTLDRIDNDGNYESENCQWATRMEQSQNKRVWGSNA